MAEIRADLRWRTGIRCATRAHRHPPCGWCRNADPGVARRQAEEELVLLALIPRRDWSRGCRYGQLGFPDAAEPIARRPSVLPKRPDALVRGSGSYSRRQYGQTARGTNNVELRRDCLCRRPGGWSSIDPVARRRSVNINGSTIEWLPPGCRKLILKARTQGSGPASAARWIEARSRRTSKDPAAIVRAASPAADLGGAWSAEAAVPAAPRRTCWPGGIASRRNPAVLAWDRPSQGAYCCLRPPAARGVFIVCPFDERRPQTHAHCRGGS